MRKIFITVLVSVIALSSCDDRMIELNRPKKNASEVPGETLFTSGLRSTFDMMVSTSVNENVFRLYAQYWAQTTYPDESQYNMVSREIPDNLWRNAYRDALMDLDQASQRIELTAEKLGLTEAEKNNQLAIITICKVYVYSVLADAFGAAPFSEALNPEILVPKYDKAEDIYAGIIGMLDGAINSITEGEAAISEDQDPVYDGEIEGWKKFANSLKLRLAITIADVDNAKASTMVTQALASGVILSNADNTSMTYQAEAPNTNPLWEDLVQSGRADFVVANTFIDKLNALADPRIAVFAEKVGGIYKGGDYGDGNSYDDNSHVGDLFHQPDLEGVIFDAAEVQFLLAEAAERSLGGLVPADAAGHYDDAITLSMEYWGITGASVTAYLANPDVAYATAAGTWKQKIGIQSWIGFYNRGFEGWNLWRRLDFTGFNVPTDLTYDDIPRRMIFPLEEATLNPTSLDEAIQLIGADDVQTKVFWDVN